MSTMKSQLSDLNMVEYTCILTVKPIKPIYSKQTVISMWGLAFSVHSKNKNFLWLVLNHNMDEFFSQR